MSAATIAVGILCGKGETDEALKVISRVNDDTSVGTILPLFPSAPTKCGGKYIFYPPAADNRRGASRTEIIRILAKLSADFYVILDDDTLPDPDYFEELGKLELPEEERGKPYLFTGRLRNADGRRNWDVCSFEKDGRPVIVPYAFVDHPDWSNDLYFSGPQHIFNRAGIELAAKVGYPDLDYGEDTHFCHNFREAGGGMLLVPELQAQLLHQHNPPNEALLWEPA